MLRRHKKLLVSLTVVGMLISILIPIQVSGKVKKITETEEKLDHISNDEKAVLEDLFMINQKIDELEAQEDNLNQEINTLTDLISELESDIREKQEDYDLQLQILEQVMVEYQRGGPATYLEILLRCEDLSSFLKSINVIKDISHNTNELLTSLEVGKKALEEKKSSFNENAKKLEQTKAELVSNINANDELKQEKQDYLIRLKEEKEHYDEQLTDLETMWDNCKLLFPTLAQDIMNTINSGFFAYDDLHLELGFFNSTGYIEQGTFNQLLAANSDLSNTTFYFYDDQVVLQVPGEHLMLYGKFVVEGECSIRYEVEGGTFYDIALEQESIQELFHNGPLLIDFKTISEGIIDITFQLNEVDSQDGKLNYDISPVW